MNQPNQPPSSLPWTGERMVPHAADQATEMFHWQRYLYFRQLYVGKKVVDAASGEGYGLGYAANFALAATGVEIDLKAVRHATTRYPHATYVQADVAEVNYADAEVVTSFETIEHLPDPAKFLDALATCPGVVIVSTPSRHLHSPGNRLGDKPHNKFHTIEWEPEEFAELVRSKFPGRRVQFLSQYAKWPGRIFEGLDPEAMYTIAVIGDVELPQWPTIGLAMPTCDQTVRAMDAISALGRNYPGRLEVCAVLNGTSPENTAKLRQMAGQLDGSLHIIECSENLGYGRGANLGFDFLLRQGRFDLIGVTNDDILPGIDCVSQLAVAFQELKKAGQNPGLVAPVSNAVAGNQMVNIGPYTDFASMTYNAEMWHRAHHSSATPAVQIRGLFFLADPQCLLTIGGFDPRFGLGNFEDDDLNIRVKLAGYSLWIAEGAYLHHEGSSTFKSLGLDYQMNMERNLRLFCEKWRIADFPDAFSLTSVPAGVHLFTPLDAEPERSGASIKLGGEVVDIVHQATDIELAAWLVSKMSGRPRQDRYALVEAIERLAA